MDRIPLDDVALGLMLRSLRTDARVWLLNAGLLALAAPACVALAGLPAATAGPALPWWLLVAVFALAEACVVHFHFRRGAHSFTLAEIPLVVGLSFVSPLAVVLAWATGAALALALGRLRPVRLVFNVALFLLAGSAAAAVLHALAGPEASRLWVWIGVYVGVLAASVTSVAAIALAMVLSGERITPRRLAAMLASSCPMAAAAASLGLALAAVLAADVWAAVTLLPVAGALLVSYRAYSIERGRHMSLELLHDAARVLARTPDPQLGLAGVLARSLDAFQAEAAEALLIGEEELAHVSVSLDGHVGTSSLEAPDLAAELRALGPHATVTPAGAEGALGEHLREQGFAGAMVAPLAGDDGALGALLVAGSGFDRADRRLFETLAQQSGSMLGRDRLGREVRELQVLRDELEHRAFHDPLTGLANRMLFTDRLRHALTRRQGAAAVIYIDLDDFKPINDTHGHEAGDAVLRAVGERLDQALRSEDTPARLGGDEFAVLLLDVGEREALIVAERLLKALRAPVPFEGREVAVGASLGLALAPSGTVDGDELLRRADAAMYVTKHGGKRGVSVHDTTQNFHSGDKTAN
ncbi:GGDEF domain-containing protein [Solirubrobacter phytolaccae]|uniref:GGDEF domain-containing protein n=1 Tax=Solirubrobacter phytolaccae TaxID=1404360 RepID=A0A9X3S9M0_9ACTN|nr:GGDEF domain-containing protein [Solirubrobacter phytolaccae]MDA0181611.1 GGDEF domain-containing protein [Solirubrobacter phytolaccae]